MQKRFSNILESHTDEIVEYLLSIVSSIPIIIFIGEVGAGKTTLIKKLVKALGSDDSVSSPTFSLVNEYQTSAGKTIYHSDWYRINHVAELYDAGIEEYLDLKDAILLVEWPEIGMELIHHSNHISIEITHLEVGREYLISSN